MRLGIDLLPSRHHISVMISTYHNVIDKLTRAVYNKIRRRDGTLAIQHEGNRESDAQNGKTATLASQRKANVRGSKTMVVSATTVARYLLSLAKKENRQLTPLELMKLVYISHGWHLGLLKKDLIKEEVEAWQYGPVVPALYHKLKQYKAQPVQDIPLDSHDFSEKLTAEQSSLISSVYGAYKDVRGIQLSAMTHEPGTPWSETWELKGKNATIPTSSIAAHYKGLAEARIRKS